MPQIPIASASQPHRLLDLCLIPILVAYAVYAITSFWQRPYLLALLLLPAPLILIGRLGPESITLAAAGSVIGPITEMSCVLGGLWRYADTGGFILIPPWIFVIWACFPTALWLIVRSLQGSLPQPRPGTLLLALACISIQIALFIALSHDLLLIIPAALLLAAAIFLLRPHGSTLILMAAGSLLGPVCEAIPVAVGAWSYTQPYIWGMPAWLPLAYALFAVLVGQASLSLCWQRSWGTIAYIKAGEK